jgi:hypothetical protein
MNRKIVIFSAITILVLYLTACDNQQVKEDASESNTFTSIQVAQEPKEDISTNIPELNQDTNMEIETFPEPTGIQESSTEVEASTEAEASTEVIESQDPIEIIDNQETENIIDEPTRYVLPRQEDFWINHYFDLEKYLTTCGLTDIEITTNLITAHLNEWVFEITTAENDHFPQLFIHREGEESGLYYVYDYDSPRTKTVICVNADELLVHQATVDALADPIAAILYFEDSAHEPDDIPEIKNFDYE